jgi:hypothetical protein
VSHHGIDWPYQVRGLSRHLCHCQHGQTHRQTEDDGLHHFWSYLHGAGSGLAFGAIPWQFRGGTQTSLESTPAGVVDSRRRPNAALLSQYNFPEYPRKSQSIYDEPSSAEPWSSRIT